MKLLCSPRSLARSTVNEKKTAQAELEKFQTRCGDFGTALNRVIEFMRNPYKIWKSGDLRQKLRVQRMVFARPIVIDLEADIGTAGLSLPFRVCAESDGQRFKMVEAPGVEPEQSPQIKHLAEPNKKSKKKQSYG